MHLILRSVVALFVDNACCKKSDSIVFRDRFVYFSNYCLSIALSNYLHRLSTVLIRLVIIVYLLHLLTRIEARRHVEIARLLSKSHIFSSLFLAAFANYLHCLSIVLIKLLITVYILHLLTEIEARRHVEMARLLPKSHVFSFLFSAAFANHLHHLSTVSIRLVITVYILHLLTGIEAKKTRRNSAPTI